MRPWKGLVWGCALTVLAASGGPAQAAWNNVFQVCCHHCRSSVSAAYPADPCPQPCPQQTCTTQYVQRSYYQPVVTYRTSTYYEPVTTYRTSYYYEPVTSYRYSCYYDPCTCRYQQVAQPVTSYRLRSQCSPVTSYLQRTCMQPVTTYQQAFYYEPVTTCCTTTTGAPVLTLPPGATAAPPVAAPPGVQEQSTPPPYAPPSAPPAAPPGVNESRSPPTATESLKDRRITPSPAPPMPPAGDESSSYRQPQLRAPVPARPAAPVQAPPSVRLDRIVAIPDHNLEGRVVGNDRTPRSGVRVLFVSADRQQAQETVQTDRDGQFRVTLAAGAWLVYVHGGDGKPVFHQKVEVRGPEPRQMTLVSR